MFLQYFPSFSPKNIFGFDLKIYLKNLTKNNEKIDKFFAMNRENPNLFLIDE